MEWKDGWRDRQTDKWTDLMEQCDVLLIIFIKDILPGVLGIKIVIMDNVATICLLSRDTNS